MGGRADDAPVVEDMELPHLLRDCNDEGVSRPSGLVCLSLCLLSPKRVTDDAPVVDAEGHALFPERLVGGRRTVDCHHPSGLASLVGARPGLAMSMAILWTGMISGPHGWSSLSQVSLCKTWRSIG